ncbi:MAG: hypothetical protein PHT07_24610 [Paludibacter sp.]|nr:hypothetical protein [Paludibacter sp.]
MKKQFFGILMISFALVLGGCAATYKSIDPPTLNYTAHDLQNGIKLSYKFDVLRESGNKKYAKKEYNGGIKLIAIAVTNLTDTTINVARDLQFYYGQSLIVPVESVNISKIVKQNVISYFPYMLLTFLGLQVTVDQETNVYPIGYVLGPSITAGNMITAGTANRRMLDELNAYNIMNRSIAKGETAYGLIGIRGSEYAPISLKIKKK